MFLFSLQDGGRLPAWIWDAHVWTTHEGHLVVFITVQNLSGIDLVVSNNMHVLIPCELGLKTTISAAKIGGLGQNMGRDGATLTPTN